MSNLLHFVQTGYESEHAPRNRNSLRLEDEAIMLGFLLSKHNKPMPETATCDKSVWCLGNDTRVVTAMPKNNKAGIVYMNGDRTAKILRE